MTRKPCSQGDEQGMPEGTHGPVSEMTDADARHDQQAHSDHHGNAQLAVHQRNAVTEGQQRERAPARRRHDVVLECRMRSAILTLIKRARMWERDESFPEMTRGIRITT